VQPRRRVARDGFRESCLPGVPDQLHSAGDIGTMSVDAAGSTDACIGDARMRERAGHRLGGLRRRRTMSIMSTSHTYGDTSTTDDVVRALAVVGEQRIVSRCAAFRAGSLKTIAGVVTLDLREAHLAPEGAVVDAMSAFGEIRILVPPGWRVAIEGTPVGGSIKNKRGGVETADGPELRVRATAVFGEVKVKRPS
jgi:hypothetical protein